MKNRYQKADDPGIELTPTTYTVQEVFGIPSQLPLTGYEPGHPLVPRSTPGYVWDARLLRDFIEWLTEPDPDPLWISGPTGCGKTDALKNVFAGLHIPTVIVSAKSSTEPDDILGRVQLRGGDTVFVPGDLLQAYQYGYAIIFDEIDGYNPEVIMACHRLLERGVVTLDDGSIIRPASRIYMAATANTRGDGQGGEVYTATNIFNLASLNRFEKWEMSYPPSDVEEQILENSFSGKLQPNLMTAMVKTAADIRRAYLDGNCPGPISIRDLLRWGRKLIQAWNRKDVAPLYHSFDKAFGNGVDPHVRAMLHTLIQTNFGVPAPHIEGVIV
ncbi:MoxR family ATPase [Geomonas nitrogeniifigens]|uniref:AAA family ATPase n=1 Tax=Geomonas diazotrophica TaxID=2843197 RepID=UPI001C2C538B|nr:MoxR family ATPase [Geomonas nitrogeniifigens]QXE87372.1 MoxR family ATPase [Geomonas nitrogeniifigens]